jgi:hypothetical protein
MRRFERRFNSTPAFSTQPVGELNSLEEFAAQLICQARGGDLQVSVASEPLLATDTIGSRGDYLGRLVRKLSALRRCPPGNLGDEVPCVGP